jgi:phospholipid transport system substrate-binding protein
VKISTHRPVALAVALALCALPAFAATAAQAPAAAPAAASAAAASPSQLIEQTSQQMLAELDANRAKYRTDKTGLYKLVDRLLLPNFDVNYAAQQVLGPQWRSATPEQRERFVKAFYRSLLTTYGDALVEFTADRLKILPFQGDPNANRATVRTQIRRDGGDTVAVNYSLRRTPEGWKAWDVVIEGISYVQSFRQDFAAEIGQKGLEGLIKRLEADAAAGRAPSNAPGR